MNAGDSAAEELSKNQSLVGAKSSRREEKTDASSEVI
ncbi:predicted protein [Botrytis cinerea T4]|uniref:Uncharacterized protein n=1 Tax=Botryotinia fuckeliana (strain T4) TaxID=999810 RepID=G2YGW0_BOTF4|nr:predicted protein [Botrytis cinerea T4]